MNDALTGGGEGQTPVHPDDLVGLRLDWIETQSELDEAEAENLQRGRAWAFAIPRAIGTILEDRFVWELHRRAFGDVWAWAGQPRRTGTSIGIEPYQISMELRDALDDARFQLDGASSPGDTDEAIARLHHRIAAIPPFTNGNGRTTRLHTDLLARALHRPTPSWGAHDPAARERYIAALQAADGGDVEPLRRFIWS